MTQNIKGIFVVVNVICIFLFCGCVISVFVSVGAVGDDTNSEKFLLWCT